MKRPSGGVGHTRLAGRKCVHDGQVRVGLHRLKHAQEHGVLADAAAQAGWITYMFIGHSSTVSHRFVVPRSYRHAKGMPKHAQGHGVLADAAAQAGCINVNRSEWITYRRITLPSRRPAK